MPSVFDFVNEYCVNLRIAPVRFLDRHHPGESGTKPKSVHEYVPLGDAGPYEHGGSHRYLVGAVIDRPLYTVFVFFTAGMCELDFSNGRS